MQTDPLNIRNILVVRNDRFGEFLLNIPSLRALREGFPSARITVVVDPHVKELADKIPLIDEIATWERHSHTLFEKFSLVKTIKDKNFNMAVMLNPSKEFNIFTHLAGIPIRVGYDRKWGFLLTHKIKDEKYLGRKHEVEYNLDLVGLIGAKTNDLSLSLEIDESAVQGLDKELSSFASSELIALHPWTSDQVKQWPVHNFRALAERLMKELKKTIVIIGGKEEVIKGGELFQDLGIRLINLTGKTNLVQLAGLLKKCSLLISGDSGPVHLSCAVGTPVIALFRNDLSGKSPKRWGPWGNGNIVIEKPSLAAITVDEVLGKTKEILDR